MSILLLKSSSVSHYYALRFSAHWEAAEDFPRVRDDMVDFAKSKLVEALESEQSKILAALSTRILLNFDITRRDGRQEEMEQVERSMRIVYSIPPHREYMRTGHSSEPILAEAAARFLEDKDASTALRDSLVAGWIDKGNRGELVARLLLTLAYDKAARAYSACQGVTKGQQVMYSKAVPVVDFLKALLHEAWHKAVLESKPKTRSKGEPMTLEQAFDGAYVRFTHFIVNGTYNKVDTHASLAAAVRGAAIQVTHNQESVDIVIPVVMPYGVEALDEPGMSCILIQVKATERRKNVFVDLNKLNVFPSNDKLRPCIIITMYLGEIPNHLLSSKSPSTNSNTSDEWIASNEVTVALGPTRETMSATKPDLCPEYHFDIRGCSHLTYGVVDEAHNTIYAELLESRGTLQEHARPDTVPLVKRQKMKWERGPECYDWIADEELLR